MKKRGEFLDGAVDAVASKELEAGVKHGDGAGDALGSPFVSTPMCRLMPETFVPASKPLCSAVSVFLTLCASTIRKVVFASCPRPRRTSPTTFF